MVRPWPAGRLSWREGADAVGDSSEVQVWSLCTGPAKQLSSCAPPGTRGLTATSFIGAFQSEPVASQ